MGEIAMGDVIFVGSTGRKAANPGDSARRSAVRPDAGRREEPEARSRASPRSWRTRWQQGGQDFEESHAPHQQPARALRQRQDPVLVGATRSRASWARVQALTDPDLAKQLVSSLKAPNGSLPGFYQVVLKVKAMDDTPIDISYLFHRELQLSKSALSAGASR